MLTNDYRINIRRGKTNFFFFFCIAMELQSLQLMTN